MLVHQQHKIAMTKAALKVPMEIDPKESMVYYPNFKK